MAKQKTAAKQKTTAKQKTVKEEVPAELQLRRVRLDEVSNGVRNRALSASRK